ncbi:ABC transporter permease subunit [Halobacillus kuroshimensis]|uniref:ABC transporter permease subunit n=1 Tax=Halobacillus kuroshimensis TaxID=302481 RepID=A0ABS3DRK5_9BACI|nr:ABC transporter permease subunit [Halobacillus kuroshimensis]MBN8233932.1 ABC transporter permease subunit [Halobacillus kuroshimensis]
MAWSFFRKSFFEFTLTSIGILLIGSLPYLFFNIRSQMDVLLMIERNELDNTLFLHDTIVLNFQEYVGHIWSTAQLLLDGGSAVYYHQGRYFPLFPELFDLFIKSMFYLVSGLALGLVAAVGFAVVIMVQSSKRRSFPKMVVFVLESLPDIFIILVLQWLIVWVYKKTNILLFDITSTFDGDPVLLPILVLSILPGIYITKYLLVTFELEEKQPYVTLARSKGLSRWRILIIHMFRNAWLTLFNHFKNIFTFALANLLMLEIIFDIDGFMTFLYEHSVLNPEILTFSLFLVFIPFFFVFIVIQWGLESRFLKGGGSHD